MSVGLDDSKPLITQVKTRVGNAQHIRKVHVNILYVIDSKDGERGRNRTYNLLIKSQLLCQLSYAPTLDRRFGGQCTRTHTNDLPKQGTTLPC